MEPRKKSLRIAAHSKLADWKRKIDPRFLRHSPDVYPVAPKFSVIGSDVSGPKMELYTVYVSITSKVTNCNKVAMKYITTAGYFMLMQVRLQM